MPPIEQDPQDQHVAPTADGTDADNAAPAPAPEPPAEDADWDIDAVLNPEGNPGDDADRSDVAGDDEAAAAKDAETGDGEDQDGAAAAEGKDGKSKPYEQMTDEEIDADEELGRDLSEDELKQLKGSARHRIKRLTRDRARMRDELESLRPQAQQAEPLLQQMNQTGLSSENAKELLAIGATLRKGDFKGFLERINPYVEAAQRALGDKLPDDLQRMVEDGETTPEVARELARRRSENQLAQQRLREAEQYRQQTTEQEQRAAQAATVRDALNAWEQRALTSDPDYEHLKAAVQDRLQLAIRAEGMPKTKEAAQQMAEDALRAVKQFATRPSSQRPTTPRPPAGGSNPGATPPASTTPDSLDDAFEQGLRMASQR